MKIKFNKEALGEKRNDDIGFFVIVFGTMIFIYLLVNYPMQTGIFFSMLGVEYNLKII